MPLPQHVYLYNFFELKIHLYVYEQKTTLLPYIQIYLSKCYISSYIQNLRNLMKEGYVL